MADLQIESITPSSLAATDRALVRRGAGPLDHTMELVDLGDAATKDVGTTAGTVAAGDHTHAAAAITGLAAVATSGSASDLGSGTLPAARLSLTKAQLDAAVSDGNVLYVGDVTSNATHTGDATGSTALTLATVNSNVGSFGSATQVATFTVNGKGLTTAAANVAISIPMTAISDSTAAGRAVLGAASATAQTALFDVFTSGAKGLAPASGGGTTNFLRADGTWAAPAGGAGTNLSYTAATRVIASDTGTDATLPLVSSGDAGLAPASGGGTTNFLRADGTWAAPSGGGGGAPQIMSWVI